MAHQRHFTSHGVWEPCIAVLIVLPIYLCCHLLVAQEEAYGHHKYLKRFQGDASDNC